jgi:hypothetical protein
MSTRSKRLTDAEIRQAMDSAAVPPILTMPELSALIRVPTKTLYEWIARGRLDGTYRRRGKPFLFWRDRIINLIFNGAEWDD